MANIIHRVGIQAPISKVYQALSTIEGLSQWWTQATTGSSKVGEMIEFRFQNLKGDLIGEMQMEVLNLSEPNQVRWLCKKGPPDWIGTDFTFDLKQEGDYTIVLFANRNWKEATESTAHCSMKWATFLMSLKALIETGKGKPSPHDVKIDNWN